MIPNQCVSCIWLLSVLIFFLLYKRLELTHPCTLHYVPNQLSYTQGRCLSILPDKKSWLLKMGKMFCSAFIDHKLKTLLSINDKIIKCWNTSIILPHWDLLSDYFSWNSLLLVSRKLKFHVACFGKWHLVVHFQVHWDEIYTWLDLLRWFSFSLFYSIADHIWKWWKELLGTQYWSLGMFATETFFIQQR